MSFILWGVICFVGKKNNFPSSMKEEKEETTMFSSKPDLIANELLKAKLLVKQAVVVFWRNRTNASAGPAGCTAAFKDDVHK